MSKLKVLWHSNDIRAKTGLGKNTKAVLTYLANTDKYELIQFSAGINKNNRELANRPWKTIGTLPDDPSRRQRMMSSSRRKTLAVYGHYLIDEIIEEIKPDVYIGSEDIWAFNEYVDKDWWSNINTIAHVTLDSLPLHSESHIYAENCTKFLTWSDFAKEEMHKFGYTDVQSLPGVLNTDTLFRIEEEKRKLLRKRTIIGPNDFVVGFVFRNQLRKSVPNLLEAFKKFQDSTSQNSYLLLHTNWVDEDDGWNIVRIIEEMNIDPKTVLATYYCRNCKQYYVSPYIGEKLNCKGCGSKETVSSPDTINGVSEFQLNEIYNLMDVYCHPFTSGGQEIPIQEAKLTEIPTLVTDYSCGTTCSQPNTGSLPLSWEAYRVPDHNQFIKASTSPASINRQLKKIYNMSPEKRRKMGQVGRQFVLDNYSIDTIGPMWEALLDEMKPVKSWKGISFKPELPNPNYRPNMQEQDDFKFVKEVYKGFLKMTMTEKHPDCQHWLKFLRNSKNKEGMVEHFKQNAERMKSQKAQEYKDTLDIDYNDIKNYLGNEDPNDRICVILPQSIGDIIMATSLLEDIKKKYQKKIYFATQPQYFYLLKGNPYIEKVIPYIPEMDYLAFTEGSRYTDPLFYVAFPLHFGTQKNQDYTHHGRC